MPHAVANVRTAYLNLVIVVLPFAPSSPVFLFSMLHSTHFPLDNVLDASLLVTYDFFFFLRPRLLRIHQRRSAHRLHGSHPSLSVMQESETF